VLNPLKNPINFKADSIEQLLHWDEAEITEHPFTMDIELQEIQKFTESEEPPIKLYDFPVHSQGTERHIPLITETANKVSDDQREGLILSMLRSRKLNPCFNSKYEYNV
jgi:hypothetical protein